MFELRDDAARGELAGGGLGEHEIVIADLAHARRRRDQGRDRGDRRCGADRRGRDRRHSPRSPTARRPGAERAFARAGYETSPVKLRSSAVRFASGGLLDGAARLGYVSSPAPMIGRRERGSRQLPAVRMERARVRSRPGETAAPTPAAPAAAASSATAPPICTCATRPGCSRRARASCTSPPEPSLRKVLEARPGLEYVSTDLEMPGVSIHMDICDLLFRDGVFDLVICSHVLEHVPDDAAALGEIARVLRGRRRRADHGSTALGERCHRRGPFDRRSRRARAGLRPGRSRPRLRTRHRRADRGGRARGRGRRLPAGARRGGDPALRADPLRAALRLSPPARRRRP